MMAMLRILVMSFIKNKLRRLLSEHLYLLSVAQHGGYVNGGLTLYIQCDTAVLASGYDPDASFFWLCRLDPESRQLCCITPNSKNCSICYSA